MRAAGLVTVTALAVSLLLVACGGDDAGPAAGGKVKVVTSLGIFADMAKEVGGERAEVAALLPPGADPHTFELSPGDVRRITEADVVFINGNGLEGGLERTISENLGGHGRLVALDFSSIVFATAHRWLDPTAAVRYVEEIAEALKEADAQDAGGYESRARDYIARLQTLDEEIQIQIAAIPKDKRKLITYHRSFDDFAGRYGLDVAGYVVASPGGDPSPADVSKLVDTIRSQKIPAVFKEPQLNSRVLEQIASDTGAEVCTLYSDSLDDRVTTYIEMMRFNAAELARCLGGENGG